MLHLLKPELVILLSGSVKAGEDQNRLPPILFPFPIQFASMLFSPLPFVLSHYILLIWFIGSDLLALRLCCRLQVQAVALHNLLQ